jgi:hypothetical protein
VTTISMPTRRFIPSSIRQTHGVRPDWIVVLLPTAIALRTFSGTASLLVVGALVGLALIRKPDGKFQIQIGPIALFLGACVIVYSRPASAGVVLTFTLVVVLVFRLIMTVDVGKIIISLIDGAGLYLVANVLLFLAGIQSPSADFRIGGLVETTGFIRIIFPLTSSINSPPIIAGVYVAASIFLILEIGWMRRILRLVCLAAAAFVMIGSGSRVPIVVTVLLTFLVIVFPAVLRGIGQVTALVASISALILPAVVTSIQALLTPLLSLTPGRISDAKSITTLENRDYIWDKSFKFWMEWVNDLPQILFGFGVNGQYRSGASFAYSQSLSTLIRNPEFAYVHNAFLQQLFDGGLVGWFLLVAAAYWATARFAKRRRGWGHPGSAAIVAMTALLLSGMTEASLAPGVAQESFWMLVVMVGVSCQVVKGDDDVTVGTAVAQRARGAGVASRDKVGHAKVGRA